MLQKMGVMMIPILILMTSKEALRRIGMLRELRTMGRKRMKKRHLIHSKIQMQRQWVCMGLRKVTMVLGRV
jgi:hypothetical protein